VIPFVEFDLNVKKRREIGCFAALRGKCLLEANLDKGVCTQQTLNDGFVFKTLISE